MFTSSRSANPYRVIVDAPDVNFQMPEGIGKEKRGLSPPIATACSRRASRASSSMSAARS